MLPTAALVSEPDGDDAAGALWAADAGSCAATSGRCADDVSVDASAVGRLAERAPQAELHDSPGDHFAPFHGDGPEAIAAAQVAFLQRTVLR